MRSNCQVIVKRTSSFNRVLRPLAAIAIVLAAGAFGLADSSNRRGTQDIKKIVTDSPWAKEADVTVKPDLNPITHPTPAGGSPGAVPNNPVEGVGSTGPAQSGGGVSGRDLADQPVSSPPAPRIIVRWDSAKAITDACAKGGLEPYLFSCYSKLMYLSNQSNKFDRLLQDFYIIGMSNYPNDLPPGRDRDAPQHSAAADAALARLGERIAGLTSLKRKGKHPVSPAKVIVLPAGTSLLVYVFFPRTAGITLDDREVEFESGDGIISLRSKFKLKQMIYNGLLQL